MKLSIKRLKMCLMMLLSFVTININAQINLQFNAINEYGFNSKQALNLTIVNSNPKSFDVILTGYIKDVNNQTVVEFKSNSYTLTTGANIITPLNLGFAELNYSNSDILEIETKTGNYPSGNYTICLWSACATPDCSGAGANAGSIETPVCTSIQVENPTPLILVTPENESEIEETRPLFTWIPPAPVAGSDMLNYTLILVEIMEGQNKADALTNNRPLIEMEGISNPSMMFPSDLPELEKDKWYAWQVQAYIGKTPLAKSEQWKFKVKKKEEKKDTVRYVKLSNLKINDFYSVSNNEVLYFTFEGDYKFKNFKLVLYDDLRKVIKTIENIDKTEDNKPYDDNSAYFGEYKMFIDLRQINLNLGKFYTIELTDNENKIYYLKFLVI